MDLGPITGIRSVSLFSARKQQKEDAPRFEIDASAQANDESFTSSQDAPERKADEQNSQASVDASADIRGEDPGAADEDHNWFV